MEKVLNQLQNIIVTEIQQEIKRQNVQGQQFSGGGFENNTLGLINDMTFNKKPLFLTIDGDPEPTSFELEKFSPYLSGFILKEFIDKYGSLFNCVLKEYMIYMEVTEVFKHDQKNLSEHHKRVVGNTNIWTFNEYPVGETDIKNLTTQLNLKNTDELFKLMKDNYYNIHLEVMDLSEWLKQEKDTDFHDLILFVFQNFCKLFFNGNN